MQRRKFLATGSVLPFIGLLQNDKTLNDNQEAFVVKNGKARHNRHMPFNGVNPNDIKVSRHDSQNGFSLFEYYGVEKIGPSLHIHFEQDEVFFVTEGKYKFRVGDDYHLLTQGDCIFLPRKIPHTWIQLSDTGKLIYMVSPAGTFEDFFEEFKGFTSQPPQSEIDRIHKKHHMKVVGPPMKLEDHKE
ncbi:MAG: hypothetical protein RLZZ546_318 [Bacteroidota bacterium]|jgi:quercetin 2,3-dioxygenase